MPTRARFHKRAQVICAHDASDFAAKIANTNEAPEKGKMNNIARIRAQGRIYAECAAVYGHGEDQMADRKMTTT